MTGDMRQVTGIGPVRLGTRVLLVPNRAIPVQQKGAFP
jgi:hypothetical protein